MITMIIIWIIKALPGRERFVTRATPPVSGDAAAAYSQFSSIIEISLILIIITL